MSCFSSGKRGFAEDEDEEVGDEDDIGEAFEVEAVAQSKAHSSKHSSRRNSRS